MWWGVARDQIFKQVNDIDLLDNHSTGTKEARLLAPKRLDYKRQRDALVRGRDDKHQK